MGRCTCDVVEVGEEALGRRDPHVGNDICKVPVKERLTPADLRGLDQQTHHTEIPQVELGKKSDRKRRRRRGFAVRVVVLDLQDCLRNPSAVTV